MTISGVDMTEPPAPSHSAIVSGRIVQTASKKSTKAIDKAMIHRDVILPSRRISCASSLSGQAFSEFVSVRRRWGK
jgi:hypothetical protein